MKYSETKFVAKQYKNRKWTVWISRDGQKFMIGSEIKDEAEMAELLTDIPLDKSYYQPKLDLEKEKMKVEIQKLQQTVDELEEYKFRFDTLTKTLNSINELNNSFSKPEIKKELRGLKPDSLFFD